MVNGVSPKQSGVFEENGFCLQVSRCACCGAITVKSTGRDLPAGIRARFLGTELPAILDMRGLGNLILEIEEIGQNE